MENARRVGDRHQIPNVYENYRQLLNDPHVEILDVAVPPDVQLEVIREAVKQADHLRGILAQKPLGMNLAEAREIVRLCEEAGIVLAVNQNMRYDQSVRALQTSVGPGRFGRAGAGHNRHAGDSALDALAKTTWAGSRCGL